MSCMQLRGDSRDLPPRLVALIIPSFQVLTGYGQQIESIYTHALVSTGVQAVTGSQPREYGCAPT